MHTIITIVSYVGKSGTSNESIVIVTSVMILLWHLLLRGGPIVSTMQRRLCRLLQIRGIMLLLRDVMVVELLE